MRTPASGVQNTIKAGADTRYVRHNQLNYAYTFNSFARDMIGNYDLSVFAPGAAGTGTAEQRLLKLTLDPYYKTTRKDASLAFAQGEGHVPGVNYDRFALDQLFNKCLFTSTHMLADPSPYDRQESTRNDTPTNFSYLPTGARTAVERAKKDATLDSAKIALVADKRFDTTLIRNMLFISTAHRLMRAKMAKEMVKVGYPVVTGPPATNPQITEASAWETWDDLNVE